MNVKCLVNKIGVEFYTGVPDSQLKPLCNYLFDTYGVDPRHHIIAANEGNCVAIAAGYHMATGKSAVVYMQNSGEGNVINPITSLLDRRVYAIPVTFIIGWRGEPGIHDEPQHIFQGEVTLKLLDDLEVPYFVLDQNTTENDLDENKKRFDLCLKEGRSVAYIVRKGALSYEKKTEYKNEYQMLREEAIERITCVTGDDPVVSTTGKASRELFEIRVRNGQSHECDFLTVGSMGHASSIALGIALQKNECKVWCIDGDGAALMHMGAMAVIGANRPRNLVHIVINNGAHETVGGMPTVADKISLVDIAVACGYSRAVSVETVEALEKELISAKDENGLFFIEIKCALGAREDLGRPTTTSNSNKEQFMRYLASK